MITPSLVGTYSALLRQVKCSVHDWKHHASANLEKLLNLSNIEPYDCGNRIKQNPKPYNIVKPLSNSITENLKKRKTLQVGKPVTCRHIQSIRIGNLTKTREFECLERQKTVEQVQFQVFIEINKITGSGYI